MKLNIGEKNLIVNRQQVCEQLRLRREELGLTAEDLAENIGITPAAILKIENGDWDFKFSFLTAFMDALDLVIEIKAK